MTVLWLPFVTRFPRVGGDRPAKEAPTRYMMLVPPRGRG